VEEVEKTGDEKIRLGQVKSSHTSLSTFSFSSSSPEGRRHFLFDPFLPMGKLRGGNKGQATRFTCERENNENNENDDDDEGEAVRG